MVTLTAPAGNKSNSDAGVAARIVSQLLTVNDWLSGTPLAQRDRRLRELEETEWIRRTGPEPLTYL
jgi:hypothetical protein